MKKTLIILILILVFLPNVYAQKCNKTFTIYLVRHCEKDLSNNYSDPPLTVCGEQRAENLNDFFKDINLDDIYSTDYNRTKRTAQPTARAKKLRVKLYNLDNIEELSSILKKSKKDALVVGHSNTTGVLSGLLVGEQIGAFDLDIYNRIYKVVFYEDSGQLHLLHSNFSCFD